MIKTVTTEEQKAYLREWAEAQGSFADFNGTIGFGRSCVGIHSGTQYVHLGLFSHMSGLPIIVEAPENAYHKDEYLAVLVGDRYGAETVEDAIAQLYDWVKRIEAAGGRIGFRQPDRPSLASILHPFSLQPVLIRDDAEAQEIGKSPLPHTGHGETVG